MRRSDRTTYRYDYKVLDTVGTTKQDKYPLYKDDDDDRIDTQASENNHQINIESSTPSVEENFVSELFANNTINSAVSADTENLVPVEEGTSITSNHSEGGISNLDRQHISGPSYDANVNVSVNQITNPLSSSSSNMTTTTMDVTQLAVDEATVSDDIDDFLGENEASDVGDDPGDYDALARRAEVFRSNFRSIHKQLQTIMGDAYEEKYPNTHSLPNWIR